MNSEGKHKRETFVCKVKASTTSERRATGSALLLKQPSARAAPQSDVIDNRSTPVQRTPADR